LVSRIEPRKNHLLLLKTFYEEKFYLNYSLLFIGKRDLYYKEFEVYLENIPEEVRKKIYILENIDNSNLIEFYRAAILFIYPSFAEGFGIPPIESIAVNTPTLCSNSTAMSDFDFLNDFLFDPKDNNELTDKIKLALKENQVYSQREKMISKYNWTNNSVKFLEAVYSKT
jgi:glycosyltransferase involved in cell wall biosynthesis